MSGAALFGTVRCSEPEPARIPCIHNSIQLVQPLCAKSVSSPLYCRIFRSNSQISVDKRCSKCSTVLYHAIASRQPSNQPISFSERSLQKSHFTTSICTLQYAALWECITRWKLLLRRSQWWTRCTQTFYGKRKHSQLRVGGLRIHILWISWM